MKVWIGIDNGATGSIGIVREDGTVIFGQVPSKTEQSYTKTKQNITRIDVVALADILMNEISGNRLFALVERPLVNPKMFKATLSGVRALEAVLNVLELHAIPFQYIDSKEWQKALLPEGIKGSDELKKASLQIGQRLFPQIESKHKDRDGLLIAEYGRRKGL